MKTTLFALLMGVWSVTVYAQEARSYEVKPGDTLYGIARLHQLSVDELTQMNGLEDGVIRAGMILKVSFTAPVEPSDDREELVMGSHSIQSLAQHIGISEEDLLDLNPEINVVIEKLNNLSLEDADIPTRYEVKAGDTLYGIARQNQLSVTSLREMNRLSNSGIRPGQMLQVGSTPPKGVSRWKSDGSIGVGVYPEAFDGRMLQSGLTYLSSSLIISHPTYRAGTLVLLKVADSDSEVLCIVADESLSLDLPVMDISARVAEYLNGAHQVEVFTLK